MRSRFLASLFAAARGRGLCRARRRGAGRLGAAAEQAAACRSAAIRTRNLDFLFGALKAAPDDDSAKAIEDRIWALWIASRQRHRHAADDAGARPRSSGKDLDLAIKLLDAIVEIKPDYVEAWNRRATIYYMNKDYGRALADIRQVLAASRAISARCPGLGMILQDFGDDKQRARSRSAARSRSIRACRRIPDLVKTLTEKVEGRDI